MEGKKKIIVRFMGGLGNQLFQYAYARMLQEVYDADIYIDLEGYKNYKIRSFSLNNFQLNNRCYIYDDSIISRKDLFLYNISRKIYHLFQYLKREITGKNRMGSWLFNRLSKKGYLYNFDVYYYDTPKVKSNNMFVYGYFQSPFYFEMVEEALMKELKIKNNKLNKDVLNLVNNLKSENSIAVSIRCGSDYLNTKLDVFSKEYFYKAIDYMNEKVDNAKFYIFSDDIEKCKDIFSFSQNVTYIDGLKDYEGITVMSNCKHFIISNSSFSWFGSYLAENPNKIIIAPEKWYRSTSGEGEDIYHPSMLRM